MQLDKNKLVQIYTKMLESRMFEEYIFGRRDEFDKYGLYPYSIGQEASAVASSIALRDSDFMFLSHRGTPHSIARGMNMEIIASEIMGKSTGFCSGKYGIMGINDIANNNMGVSGMIGANMAIASGVAFAQKYKGTDSITLCYISDGAISMGIFHESMNLASIWKLPMVFFIENNEYVGNVNCSEITIGKDLVDFANTYSMPGIIVNGNNAVEVYQATLKAIEFARGQQSPIIVESKNNIPKRIVEKIKLQAGKAEIKNDECPIHNLQEFIVDNDMLSFDQIERLNVNTKNRVIEAFEFAHNSSNPNEAEAFTHIYK